jgi:TonB family protein
MELWGGGGGVTDAGRAVFLSYASQDADAIQNLCKVLRAAGIEVWFDQSELRGGDAWDALIRKQIKGCYLFVPIISANTQSREEGYFRREWNLAVARTLDMVEDRAFLLPIVIDGSSESEARVPEKFREVQWTRLPEGASLEAFVAHVRRLIAPEANAPKTPSSRLSPSLKPAAATRASPSAASIRPGPRSFVPWVMSPVLILGVGYFVADKFLASKHAVPGAQASFTAPAKAELVSNRSVAVLPFVDMSEKKDQEYFSDGLSEELIDHLARSVDLKVIARTSSFQFKGKNEDVRTIAGKLGVANLLEGSVRTSGHAMRITAQLIRASDGTHLWSHSYDRQMRWSALDPSVTPHMPDDYQPEIGRSYYPKTSLVMRQEGTCLVHFQVPEGGTPSDISIAKSTGFASLDQACIKAIQDAQFIAAKRDDKYIATWTDILISWRIPSS